MMAFVETLVEQTRQSLVHFWGEALQTEWDRDRLVFAYPLMLPDGLQVVFQLQPVSETTAILSDEGRTLVRLSGMGLNVDSASVVRLLEQKQSFFGMKQDGFELSKLVKLPIDPVEVQLFAEGLVSVAHLMDRHDADAEEENVVRHSVERLLSGRGISPKRNHPLEGRLEKAIRVSYFLEGQHGLALEVVDRKTNLHGYMQQWGWRWTDLHEKQPGIVRAMVYDPDRQDWDATALQIGRSVCEVFCPYHETDTVGRAIERAGVE